MPYEITVKEVLPVRVAALRTRTDLTTISKILPEGFRQVMTAIAGAPTGMPFVIYHEVIDETTAGDVEICAPVADTVTGTGDAEVVVRQIPGGQVASTIHTGPYDQIGPAYHALTGWVQDHGHEFAGPPRELYLNDPTTVTPEELLTEVQWPVK